MGKYKICVYAICKNEEKFVERWMNSVSEADCVVVLDTGSTDNTVAKLKELGATVFEEVITPWRFDTARNKAMEKTPLDADILVSNDLDEVFEKGWREKLESAWSDKVTRAKYLFTWSYHPDGTPNKQFIMEKIHARKGFCWVNPVHEVLSYHGENPDNSIFVKGLVLNHYPDLQKPRTQYLPLLELSAKENPLDDRTTFWLGREYYFHAKYDECIKELKKHLSLPTARWKEERCASMRYIAKAFYKKREILAAKTWLYRAIAECPFVREPYFELVKIGYLEKDWHLTYAMALSTLAVTRQSGSYLTEPESWGFAPYDYAAISCYHLELFAKAKEYATMALDIGQTERLQNNLSLIEQKISALPLEGK